MKEITIDCIRWITRKDISKLVILDRRNPHHWVYDEFVNNLKRRYCYGFLAEYQEKVVGFAIYEVDKKYIHVINFAVHPEFRRTGIGSQLLSVILDKLGRKRKIIDFSVSERNLNFQLFLKSNDFKAVQILRKHFGQDDADAYVMSFYLEESADAELDIPVVSR